MRNVFFVLAAIVCGCDPDWDGKVGPADCDPNSALNECGIRSDADTDIDADTDADSDTDSDTDSDSDTDVDTGETGDTGEPVETGDSADTADTGDTAVPCEELVWFRDADADGFGNAELSVSECEPPPDGYVADSTDCNDDDATVYPGAPEVCDGIDNDCDVDGTVDENVSEVWYNDADDDGFGNAAESVDVICDGLSDWLVDNGDDCDDDNIDVNPDADEYCDEVDNDCDGTIDNDDALDASTFYIDADSDGFGDFSGTTTACEVPSGYAENASDCDDADAAVSPSGVESCNGIDDNCDSIVDETSAVDASVWYADADSDGFGDSSSTTSACDQPSGYVSDSSDCDDASSGSYPGAAESCDGADNDCDGVTDESDASDVATWYYDADGDGYGDASTAFSSCTAPAGYVSDATDCDDTDSSINPGATEVCNEVDDNCDGATDGSDSADATYWVIDADGDGYGDSTRTDAQMACEQPSGYVENDDDCDDADTSVNPDATEVYDDFVDNDCNGTIDDSAVSCYPDSDGDGWGDSTGGEYEESGECDAGYVIGNGDCDDNDSTTNPDEDDPSGDTTDSNCDGIID